MTISRTLYNRCKKLIESHEKGLELEYDEINKEIHKLSRLGKIDIVRRTNRTRQKINYQLHEGEAVKLQAFIKSKLNLDVLNDPYPSGDRVENTAINNNEKVGANASQDLILVNNAASLLQLNQESCSLFSSVHTAGVELRHNMISSIEHDAIIICENLTPMYYLHQLKHNPAFKQALVVYRGDSQNGKRADEVKEFINKYKATIPIYYFGDFDPEGFNIAKNFQVNGIMLPDITQFSTLSDKKLKQLSGKDKFFPQVKRLNQGQNYLSVSRFPQAWHAHIHFMNQHQLGWQQEHLLGANSDWILYKS